jgi:hypothetical protein
MDKDSLKSVLIKEPKVLMEKYTLQSSLSDIFGSDGLKVFYLIDGRRTAEDVIKESGLSEERIIDIINYVEKQGFVSVERPAPSVVPTTPATIMPTAPPVTTEAAEKKPEVQAQAPPVTGEKPPAEGVVPKIPTEKKLYERFGSIGVTVYHLVDEIKNPEDILKETKLSEEELIKILQFMVQEGIIRLGGAEEIPPQPPKVEMPLEAKPELPKEIQEIPKPIQRVEMPQIEKLHAYERKEIYLPIKKDMKLLNKLGVRAALLRRYGNDGIRLFSLIDNKRTSVKMVKDSKLDINRIDEILGFLCERNAIRTQPLSIDEVRERYGDEGVTIYNRYGRDGVLLYELIDKRVTIKEIVKISKIPPKSAVEIFSFIHRILGLDIPLDVQLLKKQLGISE